MDADPLIKMTPLRPYLSLMPICTPAVDLFFCTVFLHFRCHKTFDGSGSSIKLREHKPSANMRLLRYASIHLGNHTMFKAMAIEAPERSREVPQSNTEPN